MAQHTRADSGPNGRTSADNQSVGQLVASVTRDLGALVRGEIQLAKAELQGSAISAAKGSAMFIVAALLVGLAFFMLCFAAAYGLVALGLHEALAFLVVAGVFVVLAAVVGLLGLRSMKQIGPPALTISSVQDAKALVQRGKDDDSDDQKDEQKKLERDLDDEDEFGFR